MSNYNATGIHALNALTSAGAVIAASLDATNGWGVAIPSAATYYIPLGSVLGGVPAETAHCSFDLAWTAALAGTLTIEVCNAPATLGDTGQGGPDVTDFSTSPMWQQFNPAQAASLYANASGTGNSWTAFVLTLGGTGAGGAIANLPQLAIRRMRLKLVASAAGYLRANAWGKVGS